MDAQDIRNLQEAYNQVHQVDEAVKGQDTDLRRAASSERQTEKAAHSKWKNTKPGATKKPRFSSVPHTKTTARDYANQQSGQISWHDKKTKGKFIHGMSSNEQVDIYDTIRSYLLEGGYAETPEAAEVIMVNMSEGWRESIVEEVLKEGKKEFPETKVREKAAKHEEDYIKKRNPKSMSRARKMKGIASTVEVGDDPRNTMHGQDLRKIR
jgi:hypothetical protein